MWMSFAYKKIPIDLNDPKRINDRKFFGSSILRPIIPVELSFKLKQLKFEMLLDSGADFNIIDGDIGDYLGYQVTNGLEIEFGGIQEGNTIQAKAYLHKIRLSIGGYVYETGVGFTYDINKKSGYGVLGQEGFFNLFIVKFDYSKEKIDLLPKVIQNN